MPTKKLLASLLFIAACGPAAETGADAPLPTTNVEVIIANPDGWVAGAEVVFVNPDGKVAAEVKTDATGRADALIEPGASVTANIDGLTTVLDIQPGDTIAFGRTADAALGDAAGDLAVTFKPVTGATKYDLVSPCGAISGAASPLSLPLHANCPVTGRVLAVASDANGMISSAVVDGVKLKKGAYELKADWVAAKSLTANVTNIDPAVIGALKVQTSGTVSFTTDVADISTASTANSTTLRTAKGETGGYALFITDKAGTHHQAQLAPLAGDAVTVDLSKELLAWVTGASYDAATRTAKVTTSEGDTGGLLQVDLTYGNKAWHVFGPSNGALALPTLPSNWAARGPAASDTVTAAATLIDVEGEGYDTLHVVAPYALYHYAGHPEIAAKKVIRTSK